MTAASAAALARCPSERSVRHRLYAALARALLASPPPAGAAIVASGDGARPWVAVRPTSIVDSLRSLPGIEAALVPVPWSSVPNGPPDGWRGELSAARRVDPEGLRAGRSPVVDRPAAARLLGEAGWLATQTFWVPDATGRLWGARRWWYAPGPAPAPALRLEAVASAMAQEWSDATGVRHVAHRTGRSTEKDWRALGTASLPRSSWSEISAERAPSTAEPRWAPEEPATPAGHAFVLGATGAGKSWYLADRASRMIERGEPVLVVDLHGDLAPAIAARLTRRAADRVVAVDVGQRPVLGIAALAAGSVADRSAAHLVAALKRLTPDGADLYWGFRLERILDAFVRLVQESGGTLLELYDLLTDPRQRDAARLATRSPDLIRFLDELPPILRRTPDFLWSATARLAKIVADPAVAELLAPPDGGLPVEELLTARRSVLVRVPFAELGPEIASFAGTLLLARAYFGLAARRSRGEAGHEVTVVLDEVQGLSPRLVAEMLAEGRKFGVRLLLATQFPDRLAPELRATVAGVVREFLCFRIPGPGAAAVAQWLGLTDREADRWLTDLAPGHGLRRGADDPDLHPLAPTGAPVRAEPGAWPRAVDTSRSEFGAGSRPVPAGDDGPPAAGVPEERLLLALLALEARGVRPSAGEWLATAERLPGPPVDPARLADRSAVLERRGWVRRTEADVEITAAGEARLGFGVPSGASREGGEHRRLLLAAFRIFAQRGHYLELVRQGRFDARLPDGLFRQLPEMGPHPSPRALAATVDRVRTGWAWRIFRGRDVHVEAEVSGAARADRIRRDLAKGEAHGAFVLFLVSDARRAARVRSTVRADGYGVDRAQIWTLPPPSNGGGGVPSSHGTRGSGPRP